MPTARTPAAAEEAKPQEVPNVHVALARAAAEVGHIAKDQMVTQGPARFNFRGIDDVLDAIHGPLTKHGVSIIPVGFDIIENSERTTKTGATQTHLIAVCRFTITGPAGDSIPAAALAEALDTSDKAASKVMSMGFKYAAFQALSIPVRGALDESDSDSTERVPAAPQIDPPADDDEFTTRLNAICGHLGTDAEALTAKYRKEHDDGITLEQFMDLPLATRGEWIVGVERYLASRRQS